MGERDGRSLNNPRRSAGRLAMEDRVFFFRPLDSWLSRGRPLTVTACARRPAACQLHHKGSGRWRRCEIVAEITACGEGEYRWWCASKSIAAMWFSTWDVLNCPDRVLSHMAAMCCVQKHGFFLVVCTAISLSFFSVWSLHDRFSDKRCKRETGG